MTGDAMSKELENITYEIFMELKEDWLRNLHLEWLIQGHLEKEDAIKMVKIAEESLGHNHISRDDIDRSRCVKLADKTVVNYKQYNTNKDSQNSGYIVMFSHASDRDRDAMV